MSKVKTSPPDTPPDLPGTVPTPTTAVSVEKRAVACLQYGIVSVSITLFNRAVFSVYHFNFPAFVTLVQLVVSIAYIYALKFTNKLRVSDLTWAGARQSTGSHFMLGTDTLLQAAPLALFWWLYVVSGVTALRYLNVPMYSVLRRSTTVVVVAGEWYMFGKRLSMRSMAALAAMLLGAGVAGLTDVAFSAPGYAWVGVCVLSTAAYLLLIRRLKDSGMSQHTLLLYNNVLALPLMAAVLVLGTDELAGVAAYPRLTDPRFLAFLLLSCSQAFLLNMCIFRCTIVNSALATNVTGQVKDILTTALGVMLFADVQLSPLNLAGLGLGLAGSIAYSIIGFRAMKK